MSEPTFVGIHPAQVRFYKLVLKALALIVACTYVNTRAEDFRNKLVQDLESFSKQI